MVDRRYTGGQKLAFQGLSELIDLCSPIRDMVEVGSWEGGSVCIFAPRVGHITCVDIWEDWEGAYKGLWDNFVKNTAHITNKTILKKKSVEAPHDFADGTLDLVYLDGLHDLDVVVKEIELWKPKVRKGGFIGGHDWGRESEGISDVTQAVEKCFGKPDMTFCDSSWVKQL